MGTGRHRLGHTFMRWIVQIPVGSQIGGHDKWRTTDGGRGSEKSDVFVFRLA